MRCIEGDRDPNPTWRGTIQSSGGGVAMSTTARWCMTSQNGESAEHRVPVGEGSRGIGPESIRLEPSGCSADDDGTDSLVRGHPRDARHQNQSRGHTLAHIHQSDVLHSQLDGDHHVNDHVYDQRHRGGSNGCSSANLVHTDSGTSPCFTLTQNATG